MFAINAFWGESPFTETAHVLNDDANRLRDRGFHRRGSDFRMGGATAGLAHKRTGSSSASAAGQRPLIGGVALTTMAHRPHIIATAGFRTP